MKWLDELGVTTWLSEGLLWHRVWAGAGTTIASNVSQVAEVRDKELDRSHGRREDKRDQAECSRFTGSCTKGSVRVSSQVRLDALGECPD